MDEADLLLRACSLATRKLYAWLVWSSNRPGC